MFFFFNDTATTEIYTLSLHDALPISVHKHLTNLQEKGFIKRAWNRSRSVEMVPAVTGGRSVGVRSEEHTAELQSRQYLVCRLLLEKKKQVQFFSHSLQHLPTTQSIFS